MTEALVSTEQKGVINDEGIVDEDNPSLTVLGSDANSPCWRVTHSPEENIVELTARNVSSWALFLRRKILPGKEATDTQGDKTIKVEHKKAEQI